MGQTLHMKEGVDPGMWVLTEGQDDGVPSLRSTMRGGEGAIGDMGVGTNNKHCWSGLLSQETKLPETNRNTCQGQSPAPGTCLVTWQTWTAGNSSVCMCGVCVLFDW